MEVLNTVIVNVCIPIILVATCLIRYNVFSFIYLLFLFASPFINATCQSKNSRNFTISLAVVSALFSLSQGGFQIFLASSYVNGLEIGNCTFEAQFLQHLGLLSLKEIPFYHVFRLVLPDPIVFIVALASIIVRRRLLINVLSTNNRLDDSLSETSAIVTNSGSATDYSLTSSQRRISEQVFIRKNPRDALQEANEQRRGQYIAKLFRLLLLVLLLFAGIISPAVLQAPYFISFLILITWLSVSPGTVARAQNFFLWFLLVYTEVHICLLYFYQFPVAQQILVDQSFKARLFGLTYLVQTSCQTPGIVHFPDGAKVKWSEYVSPICIFVLYYTIALKISPWCRKNNSEQNIYLSPRSKPATRDTERQCLIGEDSQPLSRNYNAIEEPSSSESPTISDNASHPLLRSESHQNDPSESGGDALDSCMGKTRLFLRRVLLLAKQKTEAYRIMLLVMMVWSVVYVSWPSFGFLLGACCLWLAPLRYEHTLRELFTPLLLAYACALMCMTYVWGFRLHEENELPSHFEGLKPEEVGFVSSETAMLPLCVQVLFTLIFWLTLYQNLHMIRHRNDRAPDQSELQNVSSQNRLAPGDQATSFILHDVKFLFSKYFIVVLVAMFFVIIWAPVVIFRIIYTIFFIYFLVTLQISLWFWRMQLRIFWWIVILYSMLVQLLIYTYQFSSVPPIYERITGFNSTVMEDIGLRQFDTKDLFVNMLTPTSFLVLLIIQVDFCHDEFMRITRANVSEEESSTPFRIIRLESFTNRSDKSRAWRQMANFYSHLVLRINTWYEPLTQTLWRLLELHWFKLVIICVCVICTSSPANKGKSDHPDAINLILLIFLVMFLPFRYLEKTVCRLLMCVASVIVLAKMIYQLKILNTSFWISNCLKVNSSSPGNLPVYNDNAEYFGMYKVTDFNSHVRPLLILWVVLTVNFVIKYHQERAYRHWSTTTTNHSLPWPNPGILFAGFTVSKWKKMLYPIDGDVDFCVDVTSDCGPTPTINHEVERQVKNVINESSSSSQSGFDSEPVVMRHKISTQKSTSDGQDDFDGNILVALVKFFGNYGFYKFGLEFTTVFMLIAASMRMDIFGYLHGIHAIIITLTTRRVSRKCWMAYLFFTGIIIFYNFLCVIGLPPIACYEYPWNDQTYSKNLRQWMFMADYGQPPSIERFNWTLALFVFMCMQYEVFKIEGDKDACASFGGEDNEPIIKDTVHDMHFGIYLRRTYLIDYLQRVIFVLTFWITMGVLFVNGIYVTTLFCLGYILLSCTFTWMGNRLFINIPKFDLPSRLTSEAEEDASEEIKNKWIFNAVSGVISSIAERQMDNKKGVLKWWKILLVYNLLVIIIKLGSELISCVYFNEINKHLPFLCTLLTLFGLECQDPYKCYERTAMKTCLNIPPGGISGDVICFAFLLIQKRIFCTRQFSQYKFDCLINNILATFGAQYISKMLEKEVSVRKMLENRRVERVKKKVNAMIERSRSSVHEKPKEHYAMIRSGTKEALFSGDPDRDLIWYEESDEEEELDPLLQPIQVQEPTLTDKVIDLVKDTGGALSGRRSRRSSRIGQSTEDAAASVVGALHHHKRLRTSSNPESYYASGSFAACSNIEPLAEEEAETSIPPEDCSAVADDSLFAVSKEDVRATSKLLKQVSISVSDTHATDDSVFNKSELLPAAAATTTVDTEPTTAADAEAHKESYLISLLNATSVSIEQANIHYLKLLTAMQPLRAQARLAVHLYRHSVSTFSAPSLLPLAKTRRETSSCFVRLLMALDIAFCARSDLLAYFFMIIAHIFQANMLSLPYPLMVFLWGMLSVPRASRRFWLVCLGYAQFCVVLKYLFQLSILNETDAPKFGIDNIWDWRFLLGLQVNKQYALFDVFVIFSIFFHRRNLKRYGQWRDVSIEIQTQQYRRDSLDVNRQQSCGSANIISEDIIETHAPTDDFLSFSDSVQSVEDGINSATVVKSSLENADIQQPSSDVRDEGDMVSPSMLSVKLLHYSRPWNSFQRFKNQLVDDKYKLRHEFYSYYFFFDLIGLFILVLGYQGFGPTSSAGDDVVSFISESRIPIPLTCMIIVQFILMLTDRGIFIRRSIIRKLYFQIFLIVLIHSYLFFGLTAITKKSFVENVPAQAFYFVKCLYFGLSAVQIRSGFPTVVLGNFLMKRINPLNLILFIVYWSMPFLPEIRSCMDWMLVRSSLGLFNWLSVEDIRGQIFKLMCWQKWERDSPTLRARNRRPPVKYGAGLTCLILIVIVIFSPILFFSFVTVVYKSNPPEACTAIIQYGGYAPLVTLNAQGKNIRALTDDEYSQMKRCSNLDSLGFLSLFQPEDIKVIQFDGTSTVTWGITPPSRRSMLEDLRSNNTDAKTWPELTFQLSCRRTPQNEEVVAILNYVWTKTLAVNSTERASLALQLSQNSSDGTNPTKSAHLINVFPSFVYLRTQSMQTAYKFFPAANSISRFSNISAQLRSDTTDSTENAIWWQMREIVSNSTNFSCPINNSKRTRSVSTSTYEDRFLNIVAFSDRAAPTGLGLFQSFSIIGLYTGFVMIMNRLFRGWLFNQIEFIKFNEMPCSKRIWNLLLEIQLVQQSAQNNESDSLVPIHEKHKKKKSKEKEEEEDDETEVHDEQWDCYLELEEELVAKLIYLYRDPVTMIKWTMPPKLKQQ